MKKVMGGVLALCALAVTMGGGSLLQLHWISTSKDQVFHEDVQGLLQAQELAATSRHAAYIFRSYLLTGRQELREENLLLLARFRELLSSAAQGQGTSLEAMELLRDIQEKSSSLEELSILLGEERERGISLEQLGEFVDVQLVPQRARLDEKLAQLISLEQQRLVRAHAATVQTAAVAYYLTVGLVLGAVLLAFGLAWAIRRHARAVRQASAFEQQLVGIVTHDLRSPLTAILLATRSLLRREETRPFSSTIERIERSGRRIESITHLLLDCTRARLGTGIPVVRGPVDLRALCHEVVEEVRLSAPGRILQEDYTGELRGQWDGARVAQVLSNLLQNALKYSPPDTPIWLQAAAQGESVRVEVHNLGAPIPRELLPRLFDPFQAGPQTKETVKASLGLGLYIVREIVRAHGGTITVRSEADTGTRFCFTLPRG